MPATSPEAKAHHKQYLRDRYHWYKEHGICTYCTTRWCAPGKTYCESCTKAIKAMAEKRDPGREQRRAYNRQRYEKLIAAGLCVECGKKPPLEGRTRCKSCTAKKNESEAVRRIKKRIAREQSKAGQGGQPDA